MYSYSRQDAADYLDVSTRSIDRYIKAWKIRTQKDGKNLMLYDKDLEQIKNPNANQEVISEKKYSQKAKQERSSQEENSQEVSNNSKNVDASTQMLWAIYSDLRQEIKNKDEIIQNISIQLGRAQEISKNSIPLIDYKKNQFLLEESRSNLSGELEKVQKTNAQLKQDLKYEKTTNYILILIVIILIIAIGWVWYYFAS